MSNNKKEEHSTVKEILDQKDTPEKNKESKLKIEKKPSFIKKFVNKLFKKNKSDKNLNIHQVFIKQLKDDVKPNKRKKLFSLLPKFIQKKFENFGEQTQDRIFIENNMLPLLIKVYACFAKSDGIIADEEVDYTLDFLRYDYPESFYSELASSYRKELSNAHNIDDIAKNLSSHLSDEEKILLGVQLYVLISRTGLTEDKLGFFRKFMTDMGVVNQAINFVYQLRSDELKIENKSNFNNKKSILEVLTFGNNKKNDVCLDFIDSKFKFTAYRVYNFILIKNTGKQPIIVKGHQVKSGEFCRIYANQRIIISDFIFFYQDIIFYFNSKKLLTTTKVYLSINQFGNPFVEKNRSRSSELEISFGLDVKIRVLKKTLAKINGKKILSTRLFRASLLDKVTYGDEAIMPLISLRRRITEIGGKFELSHSRNEYLISNNPALLRRGDILLSGSQLDEVLMRIHLYRDGKSGYLEILKSQRPIFLDKTPIKGSIQLKDGDRITIANNQYLSCSFSERVIQEERNVILTLELRNVNHRFVQNETALDNVSFTARRGEMICILGPSGCGKSTLLRSIAGHLKPNQGNLLLNDYNLYENINNFAPYISFAPHEETYDPLLTVEENLLYSAAIRAPNLTEDERKRRINARLVELGLSEHKSRRAGDSENKYLSSGERKRLNIGLEMIGTADVYLFDEPTSGLSSKDSEHIIDILKSISQNKITIVSLHQPSSRIFKMFNKALLLDQCGKMAFYGTPEETLKYFQDACKEELIIEDKGLEESFHRYVKDTKIEQLSPDFIFDVLETPLRDLSFEIIYEEDKSGVRVPSRRFPPEFWRDRYQVYRLTKDIEIKKSEFQKKDTNEDEEDNNKFLSLPPQRKYYFKDKCTLFFTILKRTFLSKLRNHSNIFITMAEAPILAVLVAMVLRYSDDDHVYSFATAFHIPTYLFLSLVVAMFLGLTNSADDVLRDQSLLMRERNHNPKLNTKFYVISKFLSLSFFAFLQCFIYQLIGHKILEFNGMFKYHLLWMLLSNFMGISIGLFVSSMSRNIKVALNIIPIVLIPQIILGGALIKYEEMNKNIDLINRLNVWWDKEKIAESSKLKVPFICEFMPLRWVYEGSIISQATKNPINIAEDIIIKKIKSIIKNDESKNNNSELLQMLKEGLPYISSFQGDTIKDITDQIDTLLSTTLDGKFSPDDYPALSDKYKYNASEVFKNEKVMSLFAKAEIDRVNKYSKTNLNVFFGSKKTYFGFQIDTITLNLIVCIAMTLLGFIFLYYILYRRLIAINK